MKDNGAPDRVPRSVFLIGFLVLTGLLLVEDSGIPDRVPSKGQRGSCGRQWGS